MSTPKKNNIEKVTQKNFNFSFATSDPNNLPIAYQSDVWDVVENDDPLKSVVGLSGQYDQHTINNEIVNALTLEETFEWSINYISEGVTITEYPSYNDNDHTWTIHLKLGNESVIKYITGNRTDKFLRFVFSDMYGTGIYRVDLSKISEGYFLSTQPDKKLQPFGHYLTEHQSLSAYATEQWVNDTFGPSNNLTYITFENGTTSTYNWVGAVTNDTLIESGLKYTATNPISKRITSIKFGNTVTEIGYRTFNDCMTLTSITAPTVSAVRQYAFNNCDNLKTVDFNNVNLIETIAFDRCENLKEVNFGNNILSIGNQAFWGCNLSAVILPPSITSIEHYAFRENNNLSALIFKDKTIEDVKEIANYGDWGVDSSIITTWHDASEEWVIEKLTQGTAIYRKKYNTYADLKAIDWQTLNPLSDNYVSNNDYAVVLSDETNNNECWRYIWVNDGEHTPDWQEQYRINEKPFNEDQWNAIDSLATKEKISSISAKISAITINDTRLTATNGHVDLGDFVSALTKINGYELTGDITLDAADVSALALSGGVIDGSLSVSEQLSVKDFDSVIFDNKDLKTALWEADAVKYQPADSRDRFIYEKDPNTTDESWFETEEKEDGSLRITALKDDFKVIQRLEVKHDDRRQHDVLIWIDTSSSMSQEMNQLGNQIMSLLNTLLELNPANRIALLSPFSRGSYHSTPMDYRTVPSTNDVFCDFTNDIDELQAACNRLRASGVCENPAVVITALRDDREHFNSYDPNAKLTIILISDDAESNVLNIQNNMGSLQAYADFLKEKNCDLYYVNTQNSSTSNRFIEFSQNAVYPVSESSNSYSINSNNTGSTLQSIFTGITDSYEYIFANPNKEHVIYGIDELNPYIDIVVPYEIDGKYVTEFGPTTGTGVLEGTLVTHFKTQKFLDKINQNTFKNCTLLRTIDIPFVRSIDSSAFTNVSNPNRITINYTGDLDVENLESLKNSLHFITVDKYRYYKDYVVVGEYASKYNNSLITRKFADDRYALSSAADNNYVGVANTQTITGLKTFSKALSVSNTAALTGGFYVGSATTGTRYTDKKIVIKVNNSKTISVDLDTSVSNNKQILAYQNWVQDHVISTAVKLSSLESPDNGLTSYSNNPFTITTKAVNASSTTAYHNITMNANALTVNTFDPQSASESNTSISISWPHPNNNTIFATEEYVDNKLSNDLTEYVKKADLSVAIVSALSVGTGESGYNYITAGINYTPTTISAAIDWNRKLHQAFINVLNILKSDEQPPHDPGRTYITFDDGTTEEYNFNGDINRDTMINAGLYN